MMHIFKNNMKAYNKVNLCICENSVPELIVVITMAVFFAVSFRMEYNINGMVGEANIYNYLVYLLGLFLGLLVYYVAIKHIKCSFHRFNRYMYCISLFLFFIGLFFLAFVSYCDPFQYAGVSLTTSFGRYTMSPIAFLFGMIAGCVVIYLINGRVRVEKCFRLIVALIFASISAILACAPNVLCDELGTIYHAEAYINSIINVMHNMPYDEVSTSIYGHYGIIYYPFVRLMGNNTYAILITIAWFVFLVYLCTFYICVKVIKNDSMYLCSVLVVFSFGVTWFKYGQYFQTYPHRILFPIIVVALICFEEYNNVNKTLMLIKDWILGILAIVFNFESGIICACVMAFYRYFLLGYVKKKRVRYFVYILVYVIMCIVCAWGIVNIYNLAVGGVCNNFKTFLFPIGSEVYKIESLRTPMPDFFSDFFVFIIVFCIPLFRELVEMHMRKYVHTPEKTVCMSLCIMGLGLLLYYVNRTAAGNASISAIFFLIMLSINAEEILEMKKKRGSTYKGDAWRLVGSGLAFFLCVYFSIESIIGLRVAWTNRNESVWNVHALKDELSKLIEEVPENTPAFGMGIPTIYYYIGWDTDSYTIDFSDMNEFSIERIHETMNGWNSFIVCEDNKEIIDKYELDKFELVKKIVIEDLTYCYYMRNKR